jgi:hypothetical protein
MLHRFAEGKMCFEGLLGSLLVVSPVPRNPAGRDDLEHQDSCDILHRKITFLA